MWFLRPSQGDLREFIKRSISNSSSKLESNIQAEAKCLWYNISVEWDLLSAKFINFFWGGGLSSHSRIFHSFGEVINTGVGGGLQILTYYGIILIRGGSNFVKFMGTPHPRIYILNETIREFFLLNTLMKKGIECNTP